MKRLALLLLCTLSFSVFASALPDFPFVTVQGEASKDVKPDMATISFEIMTFSENADTANQQMLDTTSAVLTILEKMAIPTSAITAYEIDKTTKREKDKDYNWLRILGYEFSRSLKVELSNFTLYTELMDQLLKLDNTESFTTHFDTSIRDDVTTELFALAAADAKRKAGIMAKGLGVKVDSVFAFNDSGSFESFFATFGLPDQMYSSVERMRVSGTRIDQQMFIPQFITVSKQVNVIYKIK